LSSDYIGSGFSRGHLCPSEDRKDNDEDNAATFLMTNVSPQATILNQQPWEHLESYCRQLTRRGHELYIISGGYGSGGESSRGGIVRSIARGSINVPSHFWKIIVVLPIGNNDIKRINSSTRVIAVDMPNIQSVNNYDWDHYCTSVKALEAATGFDFLNNVPKAIQEVIERKVDRGTGR
jgi:endonuclease G